MTDVKRDQHNPPKQRSRLAREKNSGLLDGIFGTVQLLDGEDSNKFRQLVSAITKLVQPKDIFERIWVRELAVDTWEDHRLRRQKAVFWNSAAQNARSDLSSETLTIDPSACEQAREEFETGGASTPETDVLDESEEPKQDLVCFLHAPSATEFAHALAQNIDTLDKIDKRITTVELVRISTLREIERRREMRDRLARVKRSRDRKRKEAHAAGRRATTNDDSAQNSR
jgi:hypothetical protein